MDSKFQVFKSCYLNWLTFSKFRGELIDCQNTWHSMRGLYDHWCYPQAPIYA